MALTTFLSGEDVARAIGDLHERDPGGFNDKSKASNEPDSFTDLINNEWGIRAGLELKEGAFKGLSLRDPDNLNQVRKRKKIR